MTEYDFAVGRTDPESFPVEAFAAAADRAIRREFAELTVYPGALGHVGLRQLMARRESEREGVEVDPDHIALMNGSMQAVTLAARALIEGKDDLVIAEEYTYPGTLSAYRNLGIKTLGVSVDRDGMRMDSLEKVLSDLKKEGKKARFIYALTTYQNPTGSVMPLERRQRLIELAGEYETPIVEDNCYADVHYEGDKVPSIYALDDNPTHIYISSLSKILAPGLRLGYVLAAPDMLARIVASRNDGGGNYLSAAIVAEYFKSGIWEHCAWTNQAFKAKRDAMFEEFERHLQDLCLWSRPRGGLFIWIRLPDDLDWPRFFELTDQRKVRFMPGSWFQVESREVPYLRLAFGHVSDETIREGIPALARCVRESRTSNEAITFTEDL